MLKNITKKNCGRFLFAAIMLLSVGTIFGDPAEELITMGPFCDNQEASQCFESGYVYDFEDCTCLR